MPVLDGKLGVVESKNVVTQVHGGGGRPVAETRTAIRNNGSVVGGPNGFPYPFPLWHFNIFSF